MLQKGRIWFNREKFLFWLEAHSIPDSTIMLLGSLAVGLAAGFGAVGFRKLIEVFQHLSFGSLSNLLQPIAPYHLILIPAIGGAIIGPLIYKFAREAKGHGVPEVMEAVALKGGRIRPQVVIVKAFASAVCIGTGGAVGREGPIAQIGSAIGSTIGQVFRLSEDRIRTLVACGAAGGIAATFNAPIGGALFAMEVILGKLHVTNFVSVVISAVIADVIGQAYEGNTRAFSVPAYSMGHPNELFLYALLGVIAAILAFGFTRFLYFSEDLWDKIPMPEYVKPVLGGLLLGTLGLLTFKIDGIPRIFGVGYESISDALTTSLPLQIALSLLFLKIIATSLTIGSGGSGGIFAPSLFMGAMLGLGFGYIAKMIFPGLLASPGAFSLVGMAAFFTGAAHAPMTSILILFEMTNDYNLILPLMFATVLSTLFSRILSRESIYTLKLTRRGIHLEQGQDIDVMQGMTVEEVMTTDFQAIHPDLSLDVLADLFQKTHYNGFPVIDEFGHLQGVITATDLDRQVIMGDLHHKKVIDICTKSNLLIALPDEPVWKPLKKMSTLDIGLVPVVSDEKTRKVLGVIRRSNIIRAYNHAIAKRAHLQHKNEMLRVGKLNNQQVCTIEIDLQSSVIGQQIKQITLPEDSLVISIQRKDRKNLMIAHGHTILQAHDRVTIFTERGCLEDIDRILNTPASETKPDSVDAARHIEIQINPGSKIVGKRIMNISFPKNVILVNIHRGDELLIPHGDTTLLPGDIIEVFGKEKDLKILDSLLLPESREE